MQPRPGQVSSSETETETTGETEEDLDKSILRNVYSLDVISLPSGREQTIISPASASRHTAPSVLSDIQTDSASGSEGGVSLSGMERVMIGTPPSAISDNVESASASINTDSSIEIGSMGDSDGTLQAGLRPASAVSGRSVASEYIQGGGESGSESLGSSLGGLEKVVIGSGSDGSIISDVVSASEDVHEVDAGYSEDSFPDESASASSASTHSAASKSIASVQGRSGLDASDVSSEAGHGTSQLRSSHDANASVQSNSASGIEVVPGSVHGLSGLDASSMIDDVSVTNASGSIHDEDLPFDAQGISDFEASGGSFQGGIEPQGISDLDASGDNSPRVGEARGMSDLDASDTSSHGIIEAQGVSDLDASGSESGIGTNVHGIADLDASVSSSRGGVAAQGISDLDASGSSVHGVSGLDASLSDASMSDHVSGQSTERSQTGEDSEKYDGYSDDDFEPDESGLVSGRATNASRLSTGDTPESADKAAAPLPTHSCGNDHAAETSSGAASSETSAQHTAAPQGQAQDSMHVSQYIAGITLSNVRAGFAERTVEQIRTQQQYLASLSSREVPAVPTGDKEQPESRLTADSLQSKLLTELQLNDALDMSLTQLDAIAQIQDITTVQQETAALARVVTDLRRDLLHTQQMSSDTASAQQKAHEVALQSQRQDSTLDMKKKELALQQQQLEHQRILQQALDRHSRSLQRDFGCQTEVSDNGVAMEATESKPSVGHSAQQSAISEGYANNYSDSFISEQASSAMSDATHGTDTSQRNSSASNAVSVSGSSSVNRQIFGIDELGASSIADDAGSDQNSLSEEMLDNVIGENSHSFHNTSVADSVVTEQEQVSVDDVSEQISVARGISELSARMSSHDGSVSDIAGSPDGNSRSESFVDEVISRSQGSQVSDDVSAIGDIRSIGDLSSSEGRTPSVDEGSSAIDDISQQTDGVEDEVPSFQGHDGSGEVSSQVASSNGRSDYTADFDSEADMSASSRGTHDATPTASASITETPTMSDTSLDITPQIVRDVKKIKKTQFKQERRIEAQRKQISKAREHFQSAEERNRTIQQAVQELGDQKKKLEQFAESILQKNTGLAEELKILESKSDVYTKSREAASSGKARAQHEKRSAASTRAIKQAVNTPKTGRAHHNVEQEDSRSLETPSESMISEIASMVSPNEELMMSLGDLSPAQSSGKISESIVSDASILSDNVSDNVSEQIGALESEISDRFEGGESSHNHVSENIGDEISDNFEGSAASQDEISDNFEGSVISQGDISDDFESESKSVSKSVGDASSQQNEGVSYSEDFESPGSSARSEGSTSESRASDNSPSPRNDSPGDASASSTSESGTDSSTSERWGKQKAKQLRRLQAQRDVNADLTKELGKLKRQVERRAFEVQHAKACEEENRLRESIRLQQLQQEDLEKVIHDTSVFQPQLGADDVELAEDKIERDLAALAASGVLSNVGVTTSPFRVLNRRSPYRESKGKSLAQSPAQSPAQSTPPPQPSFASPGGMAPDTAQAEHHQGIVIADLPSHPGMNLALAAADGGAEWWEVVTLAKGDTPTKMPYVDPDDVDKITQMLMKDLLRDANLGLELNLEAAVDIATSSPKSKQTELTGSRSPRSPDMPAAEERWVVAPSSPFDEGSDDGVVRPLLSANLASMDSSSPATAQLSPEGVAALEDSSQFTDESAVISFAKEVVAVFISLGCTARVLPLMWDLHVDDFVRRDLLDHPDVIVHHHLIFDCVNEILGQLYAAVSTGGAARLWMKPEKQHGKFSMPPSAVEVGAADCICTTACHCMCGGRGREETCMCVCVWGGGGALGC